MSNHSKNLLEEILSKLRKKISRFRESRTSIGEENTKITLVEPLLAALGWDVDEPEEVYREYRKKPQDSPVDYALCLLRTPRLFVEVKSLKKNLDDRKWASQVLGYATVVGVEWCVLTNGDDYYLYNAHASVDVEEKLFRRVRISDQTSDDFTLDTLDLLAKPKLSEKRLTLLWEAHHVDRQVQATIEKLWEGKDPGFVRLLRKHSRGLSPSDIRASLERSRIKVDFPIKSTPPLGKKKKEIRERKAPTRKRDPTVADLPTQRKIELPLLDEIMKRGGTIEVRIQRDEIADVLAKKFHLSEHQVTARTKLGGTTLWKNRIAWTRWRLTKKGEIDGIDPEIWKVTKKGQSRVEREGRQRLRLVDG